jgi:acrylyl-CoA reductase (NADPH)
MTFRALLATKAGETISTSVVDMNEQDLMLGDVSTAVDYSTVNFKDALAITGRADVIRQFPLIPGIDLAGTVEASSYPGLAVGDRVVANSWGLSQTHHGGYAQKARLKGDWLVKIPAPFSTKDAMAIGTAHLPPLPRQPIAPARRIRRKILPEGVFGIASTKASRRSCL